MKFPWRIINAEKEAAKQREATALAGRQEQLWLEACRLADYLKEKVDAKEQCIRDLIAENAAVVEKLTIMRRYFDRLVVLAPRLHGAKANSVSLFVPPAVLKMLRQEGRETQEQFAAELARRLLQRALQELWDTPPEVTHISNDDLK